MKNRAKCQVTPSGIKRWQSYSTPILVDGMMTPMRAREPIQGSCGLVKTWVSVMIFSHIFQLNFG